MNFFSLTNENSIIIRIKIDIYNLYIFFYYVIIYIKSLLKHTYIMLFKIITKLQMYYVILAFLVYFILFNYNYNYIKNFIEQ